jgi:hypothetical protein
MGISRGVDTILKPHKGTYIYEELFLILSTSLKESNLKTTASNNTSTSSRINLLDGSKTPQARKMHYCNILALALAASTFALPTAVKRSVDGDVLDLFDKRDPGPIDWAKKAADKVTGPKADAM